MSNFVSCLVTDIGVVREHNEDSAYADPGGRFFLVADGMGGHAAGEVASLMAVQGVRKALEQAESQFTSYLETPTEDARQELVKLLEKSVRDAHQEVFDRGSRESDKKGMGTTLEALLVVGEDAFVAHVGDSRTYLLRDNIATQVTTDHTVAEVLVIEGKLSPEEGRVSPLRTILVNAVGVSADVGVELAHIRLKKGDRLLLCSDGLHDYFPTESELLETIEELGPETGLKKLVDLAKERGGHDNITGISVDVTEDPSSPGQIAANEAASRAETSRPDPDSENADSENADAIPRAGASDENTLPLDLHEAARADISRVGHAETMPPPVGQDHEASVSDRADDDAADADPNSGS